MPTTCMRIITGKYRSRKIDAVPGTGTRPTSDRLRETLFNVLAAAHSLEDAVWIDLYAGSGAVGIEALSRGAKQAYLVERARGAVETIRGNLKALGIIHGAEIFERDAEGGLDKLEARAIACDICFLDPPWAEHEEYQKLLVLLARSSLITDGSIVIAEHDKRFDPGERVGDLFRFRLLIQGDAGLSFYRKA